MLKLITASALILPTIILSKNKNLWTNTLTASLLTAFYSMPYLQALSTWSFLNPYMATDALSRPLILLTCWLLPLMIIASQWHASFEPHNRQRTLLALFTGLQVSLLFAFSTNDFILFFLLFETTMIPTMIIITRWGTQAPRLMAANYFMLFTLMGSLPLLVALLWINIKTGTTLITTLQLLPTQHSTNYSQEFWSAVCLLAFLIKLPIYGAHIWLPKAHVEAPVAGSMILAAVLLKLGGYGLARMMELPNPTFSYLSYPIMMIALWGLIMTTTTCLRQTDLKSLIAYSSVSHMSLVAAGVLSMSPSGLTGALIMMIAHGLTSSTLFCLANVIYERTHSRNLLVARSLQSLQPLAAIWWIAGSLANLALPPLLNLTGELMIIMALFNWSWLSLFMTGSCILFTTAYTLYMFSTSQRGGLPKHLTFMDPHHTREHLIFLLHLLPLIILSWCPELIWTFT